MKTSRRMRFWMTALVTALCATAARADNFTIGTPTPAPYTKVQRDFGTPGTFSDTFAFSLPETTSGYFWVFGYNPWWDTAHVGTSQLGFTVADAGGTVRGQGQTPAQLGIGIWSVDPATQAQWLQLALAGWNPDTSVYWSGTLGPGDYTVTISGLAGGTDSLASGVGSGAYIAKFHLPASAVPEPSIGVMVAAGLLLSAVALRRRPRAG